MLSLTVSNILSLIISGVGLVSLSKFVAFIKEYNLPIEDLGSINKSKWDDRPHRKRKKDFLS